MMTKIVCIAVVLLSLAGCVGASNGHSSNLTLDDVLTYTGDKLAEVGAVLNTANQKITTLDSQLAEAQKTVASMESLVGDADKDGDGEISSAEAADFYARVVASGEPPEKQSEVYKALMLLLSVQFASRKLGHKLPANLQWITFILGSPTKKTA